MVSLFAADIVGAAQSFGEVVATNPIKSVLAALLAVAGVLKGFGIGAAQYKEYGGKLITWLLTVLPIPAILKPVAKLSAEKLLEMLIDKLIEEDVPEAEVRGIVLDIAPKIQKARLGRFKAAIDKKCGPADTTVKGDELPPLAAAAAEVPAL